MDFAFGIKNHTDVNQVAPLAMGVSINPILIIKYTLLKNHFTKVCKVTSYTGNPNLVWQLFFKHICPIENKRLN